MWTADKVIYRGDDSFVRAYQYDTLVWSKYSQNVIFYTSTDGNVVTPITDVVPFIGEGPSEAVIVSNTYSNGLGRIALDRPVIQIGPNAFWGKRTLSSIVIPSTVTRLRDSCFLNCTGLTSVTIPSSVTRIDGSVFSMTENGSLVTLTLPSSVTYIGDFGLAVDSLRTLIVNSIVPPTLGNLVFTLDIQEIKVPAESLQAYKTATGWSLYASKIVAQ